MITNGSKVYFMSLRCIATSVTHAPYTGRQLNAVVHSRNLPRPGAGEHTVAKWRKLFGALALLCLTAGCRFYDPNLLTGPRVDAGASGIPAIDDDASTADAMDDDAGTSPDPMTTMQDDGSVPDMGTVMDSGDCDAGLAFDVDAGCSP